jgi:hypothetical protein
VTSRERCGRIQARPNRLPGRLAAVLRVAAAVSAPCRAIQARRGIRFRAQLAVKDENFVKDQFDDYINSMRMRAGVRAADT